MRIAELFKWCCQKGKLHEKTRGQSVGNKRFHVFLCAVPKVLRFLVTPLDSAKR